MKPARIPPNVRKKKLRACPFCVVCGTDKSLELNHIDPAKPSTFDNLIVVCSKHHGVWHEFSTQNRHTDKVKNGMIEAKARGTRLGRPPKYDKEKVMRLIAENSTQFNLFSKTTESEIMEMAGVRPTCYAKYKRELLNAMDADVWPYDWPKPKRRMNRPLYDNQIKKLRGDGQHGQDLAAWPEARNT